ncbi:hypothetical protein PV394_04010 [Streptomyces sp. NE06-03E]|uniref:hypothetical protein n=1 Tax=unclassified Streptomyces TaxID=2593676 RepID=UPI0029A48B23|nr:hypothetical protein [Streptomyces sp. NE06-03E]MDX3054308.1 hypothetical protein [Streptomyces sp. NE06-03E]
MRDSEIWSPRVWLHNKLVALCECRTGHSDRRLLDDAQYEEGGGEALSWPTLGRRVDLEPGETARQALEEAVNALTSQERAYFRSPEAADGPHCNTSLSPREPFSPELIAEIARQSLRSFHAGHVTVEQRQAVVREFRFACETGDLCRMFNVLAPDVSAVIDGGGKVRTPDLPISGAWNVTRYLGVLLTPIPGITIGEDRINGQSGLVVRLANRVVAVVSVDVRDGHVLNVWLVLNPDKLSQWNRCRDWLTREGRPR